MDGGSGAAVCPLKGGESPADGHFPRASGELDALKGCQESENDNECDRPRAAATPLTLSDRPRPSAFEFRQVWRASDDVRNFKCPYPAPSYHHKHLIDGLAALSASLYS